jgi:hypothetical protein
VDVLGRGELTVGVDIGAEGSGELSADGNDVLLGGGIGELSADGNDVLLGGGTGELSGEGNGELWTEDIGALCGGGNGALGGPRGDAKGPLCGSFCRYAMAMPITGSSPPFDPIMASCLVVL